MVGVFVKTAQMGRDAGVETADDVVEDFLFYAHLIEQIGSLEAIFFVDQFPDIGAVVIGEGFYIGVNIEVLTPIVGLILNVPYPSIVIVPFIGPEIEILGVSFDFFGAGPKLRDIFVVASADCATFALADLFHHTKGAFLIDVESDDPEEFGLD